MNRKERERLRSGGEKDGERHTRFVGCCFFAGSSPLSLGCFCIKLCKRAFQDVMFLLILKRTHLGDFSASGKTRVESETKPIETTTSDAKTKSEGHWIVFFHFSFFFLCSLTLPLSARLRLSCSRPLPHARTRTPEHATESKKNSSFRLPRRSLLSPFASIVVVEREEKKKRWLQSPPSPGWTSSESLFVFAYVVAALQLKREEGRKRYRER